MKRHFFIPVILLLCLVFTSCSNTRNLSSPQAPSESFSDFADAVFKELVSSDTLTLNYSLKNPSLYEIYASEVSYGGADTSAYYKEILSALDDFAYDTLDSDEQLLYDTLRFLLEAHLKLDSFSLLDEPLSPSGGIQAELPLLLSEYTFYSKSDVHTYLDLLNTTYEYFEELAAFEKEKADANLFMSKTAAETVIAECISFAEVFKTDENNPLVESFINRLREMGSVSEVEYATFMKLHRTALDTSVIPGYELLAKTLSSLLPYCTDEQGICALENGKEFYEAYAAFLTGSSKTIEEMNTALEGLLADNIKTMTAIYKAHPDVIEKCSGDIFPSCDISEVPKLLAEEMLSYFPALPSDSAAESSKIVCEIKYVPDSLSAYLSPAMYLIPPIDDFYNNVVYINPLYNTTQVFPTIAHETYPGHLYQHVYFNLLSPHPLRNVLSVLGWEEGWATYAEACSYYFCGFEDYVADYLVSGHYMLHTLYSLTDLGIHYYGWTKNYTLDFWANYGVSPETAEEIFTTVASEPCMYLPYGVGCMEILELKALYEEINGTDASLKDFHTFILETGPAPFESIKNKLKN